MKQAKESFQQFADIEELDSESKYLVHKAKEATAHSYAPYSKFQVGAALILDDGTVITGANQENASYPLCMCAERVALYASSATHPDKRIVKIAVAAHKKGHKELAPASPCGACRQVILEYEQRQDRPIEIVMYGSEEKWVKCTSAATLLPLAFNKESL
jgi:cytidine deaminase